mmetsp:Transcript_25842/g.64142  ORF Transcript_25842/g.64142 Transcript_25842/m.64142 type:complete len:176 (-) Transcript_25842:1787-2314(-)
MPNLGQLRRVETLDKMNKCLSYSLSKVSESDESPPAPEANTCIDAARCRGQESCSMRVMPCNTQDETTSNPTWLLNEPPAPFKEVRFNQVWGFWYGHSPDRHTLATRLKDAADRQHVVLSFSYRERIGQRPERCEFEVGRVSVRQDEHGVPVGLQLQPLEPRGRTPRQLHGMSKL